MCETSQASGGAGEKVTEVQETNDNTRRAKQVSTIRGAATDFFIPDEYRPGQREAIEKIDTAFQRGARFVILEGPTGIGKSHIARAFAFQYGNSHILTIQKGLQDQYATDFPDMYIVKGRGAYTCKVPVRSCANGPCKMDKTLAHDDCPYKAALTESRKAPVVVHNFDSFYYQGQAYPHGERELIVVDEAHNIENKFLNFMEFVISNKEDVRIVIPKYDTLDEYAEFLEIQHHNILAEMDRLVESRRSDPGTIRRVDELKALGGRIHKYFEYKDQGIEYVFEYNDKLKYTRLMIKPVMVGDFVENYLLSNARRVLLMSATILDKGMFCESVGINPREAVFIQMPSIFPIKNRPIVFKPAGKMSWKFKKETQPKMLESIQKILAAKDKFTGIIQTHNEEVANYIKYNLDEPRLTFRKDYFTVEEMMEVHRQKEASVIVASGLREGVDLKDGLSRFQIICKVPWPNKNDPRVKRRVELKDKWYIYMAALMFVQMLGRSVRSVEDKAITYILDEGFKSFFNMGGREFIPQYIRRAIKWAE